MGFKITEQELREMIKDVIREETEYQKFFNKALTIFGISSPKELSGDKETEFYDYVDKHWEADNETD